MSHEIGKILIQQKQYKKASDIFKKLIDNKPNDLRANFLMGKIQYDLNNVKKSIFFLKNVMKFNQIHPIFSLI